MLRVLAHLPHAQVARGNVLGSAAVTGRRADGSPTYRRLDLWVPHYCGPGRMLGIDVAVTDPLAAGALGSSPSSADVSGRAGQLRAEKKVGKYEHLVQARGGIFRAGVVERFGAVDDGLSGLLRQCVGDQERLGDEDDFSFTARRQLAYAMQHVVFATVIADSAMLDSALERDVYRLSAEAAEAERARAGQWGGGRMPYRRRAGRGVGDGVGRRG